MTFPEWTKPGVYGALLGAVSVAVLGFSWGGWTTAGGAEELAQTRAAEKVTLAMVPVCLDLSAVDADRIAKLAKLQETSSFQRRTAMMETGWATLPGKDAPNRDLATACLAELALDGS